MSTTTLSHFQAARARPGAPAAWSRLVCGSLLALVALGLVTAGIVLVLAHATARDSTGFYTSATERFTTSGFALTSEGMQIGDVRGDGAGWALDALDATVRVRASAPDGRPVFIGIAPKADVDRYLARSAHAVDQRRRPLPRSRTARSSAAARSAAGDAGDADLLGGDRERLGHAVGDLEAARRALGRRGHERGRRPDRER